MIMNYDAARLKIEQAKGKVVMSNAETSACKGEGVAASSAHPDNVDTLPCEISPIIRTFFGVAGNDFPNGEKIPGSDAAPEAGKESGDPEPAVGEGSENPCEKGVPNGPQASEGLEKSMTKDYSNIEPRSLSSVFDQQVWPGVVCWESLTACFKSRI